jgi:hypothetical protein
MSEKQETAQPTGQEEEGKVGVADGPEGKPSSPLPSGLHERLKPLEREIATYWHELPRLLQEGEANRFAVIKGDQVLSIWDTYRDASQYGSLRFDPDEPFMVQRIDQRDLERLARLFPERGA